VREIKQAVNFSKGMLFDDDVAEIELMLSCFSLKKTKPFTSCSASITKK
jgi:hypothetical protein